MWSFVAGADAHIEGFTRLQGVNAALSQHAPMQEGVAGPIREFNEPEAFVGVEPFDDPLDWWTGRCLERRSVEPGSGAEGTGLWMVVVSVEVTTPRMTKILISQLWFLVGSCR